MLYIRRVLGKMVSFREVFSVKRFVCCTLTVLYGIHTTVGWSIASIYHLSVILTPALRTSVNMSPWIVFISYRPPYRTIYITLMCTQSMDGVYMCISIFSLPFLLQMAILLLADCLQSPTAHTARRPNGVSSPTPHNGVKSSVHG